MVSTADKLKLVEKKYIRTDLPELEVGDTVRMRIKVVEADKVRSHPYDGTIIRKSGGGVGETFTVRKISFREGVERTFPLHSPMIESIKVVSKGVTKRAKLYYLRNRIGKRAKLKVLDSKTKTKASKPSTKS